MDECVKGNSNSGFPPSSPNLRPDQQRFFHRFGIVSDRTNHLTMQLTGPSASATSASAPRLDVAALCSAKWPRQRGPASAGGRRCGGGRVQYWPWPREGDSEGRCGGGYLTMQTMCLLKVGDRLNEFLLLEKPERNMKKPQSFKEIWKKTHFDGRGVEL